jgi:putative DNA methylase
MSTFLSFIESQFPVSKISKESYKERMANNSQTLTGLGKWWGRKPLILVRATILGLLMPASADPLKDREIFLKILSMDEEGLWLRKDKNLSLKELFQKAAPEERAGFFSADSDEKKANWRAGLSNEEKEGLRKAVFHRLSYDEKLRLCKRPEHLDHLSTASWQDINAHLGTTASSLPELVQQLGERQFGHLPRVGDAFCGGGSIPFEAARMGCEAYGSDLNPVAALLTWAALNIIGGGEEVAEQVRKAQQEVYAAVDRQISDWGIEHNEKGWRADAYLYCVEARDPQSGYMIPLAPSWVIGEKTKCVARLVRNDQQKAYDIEIHSGVSDAEMAAAKAAGTVQANDLVNPDTGERTPIATLRGPEGLRLWENGDLVPRPDDVFQERLYCIRYVETYYEERKNGKVLREVAVKPGDAVPEGVKLLSRKHYVAPDEHDLEREAKVLALLEERFTEWQEKGYVPAKKIESGYNTDQPIRERGWSHWHHLFNPRQLFAMGVFFKKIQEQKGSKINNVANLIAMGRTLNYNSRLSAWHSAVANENVDRVFVNQSLNTLYTYSTRTFITNDTSFFLRVPNYRITANSLIQTSDARGVTNEMNIWITDPPYADAINYHELGDFFLAWYEKYISKLFPSWYSNSRQALAIKGTQQDFRLSMVEAYSNLAAYMPDNGAQVVMFTHQDSAVWADLAMILWASGLQVTTAWTIQTETEAVGIKTGNYVQGTVIMVLRKQQGQEVGFLSDIQADVEYEVRQQLHYMMEIEDQEDPNFGDADYQLAAYAAALRVLTSYQRIEDIDIAYELSRERKPGEQNEIEKIIESAVKVAMDYLVPSGFEPQVWRTLSPEERFYIKGVEVQSHGEYRTGVYQEMARGFGLKDYRLFLHSGKANEARLMTGIEFGNKELKKEGFGNSLLRHVLFAIRQAHREESPRAGRMWLYQEFPGYWESRKRIIHLLQYLEHRCEGLEHWKEDVSAARVLRGYLENDSI